MVPENEEKPITEVLDFAMREIVKQDSLTDELICPMLRIVFIFTFKRESLSGGPLGANSYRVQLRL